MTSSPSEDVQITGMRIALQYFLDLQRQAVHPTPHVGVADCQPNAYPRRDRDHRPDSALTTAAANPAGIEAGMHMSDWVNHDHAVGVGKSNFIDECRSCCGRSCAAKVYGIVHRHA